MKRFDFRDVAPEQPLTFIFASTSTAAWYPERCRCDTCSAHDFQINLERKRNDQRARDHWNRRQNYLEPTIARLDHCIAILRRFAA